MTEARLGRDTLSTEKRYGMNQQIDNESKLKNTGGSETGNDVVVDRPEVEPEPDVSDAKRRDKRQG